MFESILTKLAEHFGWAILKEMIGKIPYTPYRIRLWYQKKWIDRNWEECVNMLLSRQMHMIGVTDRDPIIVCEKKYKLTERQEAFAAAWNKKREEDNKTLPESKQKPNDMHVIVVDVRDSGERVKLICEEILYSGIRALHNDGEYPNVLAGNALIFSSEKNEILLHKRAGRGDTDFFPDALHIFGGGYTPLDPSNGRDDNGSVFKTAKREAQEETRGDSKTEKVAIELDELYPGLAGDAYPDLRIILSKDLVTGYVQVSYVGFDVPKDVFDKAKPNWEGVDLKRISFEDLDNEVLALDCDEHAPEDKPTVTPTGKGLILAWLLLGAPGCRTKKHKYTKSRKLSFGGLSTKALFY